MVSSENTASIAPAADRVWPIIDLFERDRHRAIRSPNTVAQRQRLHLVVLGRAGAVGVDVVDLVRGSGRHRRGRCAMAPMIAEPSGLGAGAVEVVGLLAAAAHDAEDLGAARLRRFEALQHQRRRRLRP